MSVPYSTSNAAGVDFTAVYTPATSGYAQDVTGLGAPMPVGSIMDGTDGSKFVLVLLGTGGATGNGYVLNIDEAYGAVMLAQANDTYGDKIGVARISAAAVAGDYIWAQVYGVCDDIQCEQDALANAKLAATTTAGQIDDAGAAGTLYINGLTLTTARGGTDGLAPGWLNYPMIDIVQVIA